MKHLTVRNVPDELAEALSSEKERRGQSLNGTILALLKQALGLGGGSRTNGLERLAGGWSRAEAEEFDEAVAVFEQVDDGLWR